MGVIMKNGIAYGGGSGGSGTVADTSHIELTFAEYKELEKNGQVDSNATYFITDENIDSVNCSQEITQAEYDALVESGKVDPSVSYYITDSEDNFTAENILFNESESGLTANTVQGAIESTTELISDVFDSTKSYATGSYCIHNNALFEFIANKSAGDWDVSKVKQVSVATKLSEIHPIGSTYITSTNTNPSTLFGGTWELYDKEYKTQKVSNIAVTMTNVSAATVHAYISGHDIQFFIQYTPSVDITDSSITLLTIPPSACGATQFSDGSKAWSHFSDNGQAVIMYNFSTAGVLASTDVMVRGSSTALLSTTANVSNFNSILIRQTSMSYMLDSFCDKFYWKRTA